MARANRARRGGRWSIWASWDMRESRRSIPALRTLTLNSRIVRTLMSHPDPSSLAEALADHRAGRTTAAQAAYRAIIATEPRHAGAHHHLGVLLVQTGRLVEGLIHLKAALEVEA